MYRKLRFSFAVLMSLTLLLSACAGTETTVEPQASQPTQASEVEEEPEVLGDTGGLPDVDPASVSGNVLIAGSSTVYPLTERMVERFIEEGYSGQITVDSVGSGAGLERFCVAGETDIAAASRGIEEEEIANCANIGRTPIEFRVGTDALAIAVSTENDFLTGVTLEQLAQIFSSDAVLWSDVNPEWPTEDILRFSPGTDSGTYDYFVEAVMMPVYGEEGDAAESAILNSENIQFSEDDNVLVQGVQGSPYAIGYFGYAYYIENEGTLKALAVDDVVPNEESAESGDYPLARPLFLYSDAQIMQSKPQVADFLNFYLTYVNDEILSVGYFPASDAAIEEAKQAWLTNNQ
ncbi:MAG: PstS family phosphate ABC transporter substrate-binding protein [Chloroflexi bacterium]|nr:MAG: PstS family phosphate ABC transporter substrate-binding protein [Chloroflexota bacterium]